MASQRITILKIAGLSGNLVWRQLSEWSAARSVQNPDQWSSDQWPVQVKADLDKLAGRLREHGADLPICHFVEWVDLWSMGDMFPGWLTTPNRSQPLRLYGDRYEVFAYTLPDEGRLANILATAEPQQFTETDLYIRRLLEAIRAWESIVPTATLIVLRDVINGFVSDKELSAALTTCPEWLLQK